MTIRTEGADDLERLARALKEAGDKALSRQVGKALREAGKPLGADVIRDGSATLPARGGLRARVEQARTGITASLGTRPKITLRLKSREGYDLGAMNRGQLRHPVYGGKRWVSQQIHAGGFTDAFTEHAPSVQTRVRAAVEAALADIARSV